jgi:hypothetical protein
VGEDDSVAVEALPVLEQHLVVQVVLEAVRMVGALGDEEVRARHLGGQVVEPAGVARVGDPLGAHVEDQPMGDRVRGVVRLEGTHLHRADLEFATHRELVEGQRERPVAPLHGVPHGGGEPAYTCLDARRARNAERCLALVLVEGRQQQKRNAPEVIAVEM